MSDVATETQPKPRTAPTWNTRKCANDACGEMNHVKRNTCKICGTTLPVTPHKERPRAAKSPLTRSAVIAANKKARAEAAAKDQEPAPIASCPAPPVLSDITVTSAAFVLPTEPPPAVAVPDRPSGRYIVMDECRTTVNGTLVVFPKGHVLTDLPMIEQLLAQKMPIASEATVLTGTVCCPNCNHLFTPNK